MRRIQHIKFPKHLDALNLQKNQNFLYSSQVLNFRKYKLFSCHGVMLETAQGERCSSKAQIIINNYYVVLSRKHSTRLVMQVSCIDQSLMQEYNAL